MPGFRIPAAEPRAETGKKFHKNEEGAVTRSFFVVQYYIMMTLIKILFILLLLAPVALLMRYLIVQLRRETPKQPFTGEDAELELSAREARELRRAKKQAKQAEKQARKAEKQAGRPDKQRKRPTARTRTQERPAGAGQAQGARGQKSGGDTPIRQRKTQGRRPEELHRSERVPFGEAEGYRVVRTEPSGAGHRHDAAAGGSVGGWTRPSDALRERTARESAERNGAGYPGSRSSAAGPRGAGDGSGNLRDEGAGDVVSLLGTPRSQRQPSDRQLRRNRARARKSDLKRREQERKQERKDERDRP